MSSPAALLSTAVDHSSASGWSALQRSLPSLFSARRRHNQSRAAAADHDEETANVDADMQLPKTSSLVICLLENVLGQVLCVL